MDDSGVWGRFSGGRPAKGPQSVRTTVLVIGLLLVGVAYVVWNPISGGEASIVDSTPAPTAQAGGEYFLRTYEEVSTEAQPEANGWAVAADMIIKLLLVVGLIYLTAWGLRTVMRNGRLPLARTRSIGVLESTNLAPNKSLYLVEVGGKVLLLGGTPTQLSLLSEFSDPEVVKGLRGEGGFSQHLEASTARLETQESAAAQPGPTDGQTLIRDCVREIQQISRRLGRKE